MTLDHSPPSPTRLRELARARISASQPLRLHSQPEPSLPENISGVCAMRFRTALLAAASLTLATVPAIGTGQAQPARLQKAALRKASVKHTPPTVHYEGVSVVMDQVRIVTFKRPVSTVFIGNPIIADATVIDPYHAFILGKAYGVTNLIALSSQSQTVVNQQITVANRSGGVVTLNKGAAQFTYSCTTAHCETNPRPGDNKAYFDETESAVGTHQDSSIKAASAAQAH